VCHGRLVSVARGEQDYFDPEGIATATEGCKSNALMRCCKDLGIASELWYDPKIRNFNVDCLGILGLFENLKGRIVMRHLRNMLLLRKHENYGDGKTMFLNILIKKRKDLQLCNGIVLPYVKRSPLLRKNNTIKSSTWYSCSVMMRPISLPIIFLVFQACS
jgi:hypothetical protein